MSMSTRSPTVRQKDNEALYRLLREFNAITGVPILLNTSFNVKGEPIVERPHEAVECFLTTGIDYLAIHNLLLSKNGLHRIVSPILRAYSDVRSIIQANTSPGLNVFS